MTGWVDDIEKATVDHGTFRTVVYTGKQLTVIPGGTWHNVINEGAEDLKLYSIYAPPEHPEGTVHPTKADADAADAEHHH